MNASTITLKNHRIVVSDLGLEIEDIHRRGANYGYALPETPLRMRIDADDTEKLRRFLCSSSNAQNVEKSTVSTG